MNMISLQDLGLIAFLVFLEGILSIDNALVLAMMARPLPLKQQRKALTYGLIGAVVFRLVALTVVTQLIAWTWVKFVGGGYLVVMAVRHFIQGESAPDVQAKKRSFWMTVVMIELMDIAFAVDSILAAVALTPKFWIIFTGGFLGVVLMRVAANSFIGILNRFPGFETTAYLLVGTIGIKVILEGLHLPGVDFHSSANPAPWVFWALMAGFIALGFRKPRQ